MRDELPPSESAVRRGQRRERSLLPAYLVDRIVWYRFQRKTDRQRFAQRDRGRVVREQGQRSPERLALRRPRNPSMRRWLPQVRDPGAEQAVARLQPVIEEAERSIGGEG